MSTADNGENLLFSSSEFKKKLFERINGISSNFNINYPINPKLRYEYPPLNQITLENIVNALISLPSFYVQTLHLMNKMNLPCPLVSYVRTPRPRVFNDMLKYVPPQLSSEQDLSKPDDSAQVDMSTSHSESDAESEIEMEKEPADPILCRLNKQSGPKKLKIKSFLNNENQLVNRQEDNKTVSLQEIFEQPAEFEAKCHSVNKSQATKPTYDRQIIQCESEGFAKIIPINMKVEEFRKESNPGEDEIQGADQGKFITKTELEKNRLKMSELRDLAVFKNYDKGQVNTRIYLKNLSKTVSEADLKFIYGRYIDWTNETHSNAFDIRLMKEGRMKGN